jgi:hypothetical protein
VQFEAPQGATGEWQIALVNDHNFTYFDDKSNSPSSFTGAPGTVTITGGSGTETPIPTPEPSTLLPAALMTLSGLLWYWYRRRQGLS